VHEMIVPKTATNTSTSTVTLKIHESQLWLLKWLKGSEMVRWCVAGLVRCATQEYVFSLLSSQNTGVVQLLCWLMLNFHDFMCVWGQRFSVRCLGTDVATC